MTLIVAFCMEVVRLPKHGGCLAFAKDSKKILNLALSCFLGNIWGLFLDLEWRL